MARGSLWVHHVAMEFWFLALKGQRLRSAHRFCWRHLVTLSASSAPQGQGVHVCWPPSFSITPAKSSRVLDCHCSPGTVEPDVNSLLPLHRQPLGEAGGVTNLFFLTSLFMDNILHCQHFFWQKELELKKPDHKLVRPERHSSYFLLCPFTTVTPWTKVHSSLAVSVNGRSFTASFSLCWAPKWDGVAWWGHLLT